MILILLEALFYLLLPEINPPKSGLGKSSCVNLWKVVRIANKKKQKKIKQNKLIHVFFFVFFIIIIILIRKKNFAWGSIFLT